MLGEVTLGSAAHGGSAANGVTRERALRPGVSLRPSRTEPYWACPRSACEAIIDPPAHKVGADWLLPYSSRALEGGGEKGGFDPQDLESAYAIPSAGGSNQTIALVDAYGYESAESDLAKYRERYGLEPCTRANGCFRKVNQAGEEAGYPGPNKGWEGESSLDLDMASAACPHCHILLVEATGAGTPELGAAVDTAARLGATEISNSYGIAEENCPKDCEEYDEYYEHPGVVITASAGDDGYDGHYEGAQSPSFPATSPSVVSVGGTSLKKAEGTRGWSEEVWNEPSRHLGSGGGCSHSQTKPLWQSDRSCAHRIDNDAAAVAACESPLSVYSTPYGGWEDVCGTSASSPLVAGIAAHASEYARALPAADAFYADPGAFFDVTKGNDGECVPPAEDEYFCHAETGYDGPTGLGTPAGPLMLTGAPPALSTHAATAASAGGVTLNGALDPNALETTYHFEYGTSTAYGTSVPVPSASVGSGAAAVEVSQSVSGLQASTTYHYRVVATNSAGTSYGADQVFRTATPTVTGLSTSGGPAAGGTSVTISGSNFVSVQAVKFGGVSARFTVESETSISALSPAAPAGHGTVDVTVSTPAGTSATSSADRFAYTLGPALGFGYNPYGDLGNDATEGSHVPVEVLDLPAPKKLVSGGSTGMALLDDGSVMLWGINDWGQLGPSNSSGPEKCGSEPCSLKPVPMSGLGEEVTAIAAGSSHELALLKGGTVMAWGENYHGQLGNAGGGGESDLPLPVCTVAESPCKREHYLQEVTAIAAGEYFSLALLKNGTVVAWGENDYGELGDGTSTGPELCDGSYYACSITPVKVSGLSEEVRAIAAGGEHGLALLKNGTVMAWGANINGQLGNGTITGPERCKPTGSEHSSACATTAAEVQKLSKEVSTIAAGSAFSLALLKNGTVSAWGHNYEGELGDGTTSGPETCVPEGESARPCSDLPVAVVGLSEVRALAARGQHTLALLKNGRVKDWGGNYTGELGIGSTEEKSDVPEEPCAALELVPCANHLEGVTVVGAGDNQGYVSTGPLPAPTVTEVRPSHGESAGGSTVTIAGANFTGATAVNFGTVSAAFTVSSENSITAVAPPGAGTVDVTVTSGAGTSPATPADRFTYAPSYSLAIEPGALAGLPTDVAANSEGDLWVSSWETGTVAEFKENGEPLRTIGALEAPCSGQLEGPYGLALDSASNLWVTDLLDGYVRKFSPEGKCLLQVALGGAPRGIAVDAHGNVWVSGTGSGCVQELSGEGVSERSVGCALGGAHTFPGGLAIDPHGHIWVADIANSRVVKLGEAGEYLGQIGNTTNCGPLLCLPMAVASDASGNILVASASRIDQFSEDGELLNQVGGFGSEAGQMEFPLGVDVDSKGNVWAADTGNRRVEKWLGG